MTRTGRQIERLFDLIRTIDPSTVIAPEKRHRFDIKQLGPGSVYGLEDKIYLVQEIGTYAETDEKFQKQFDWTGHEIKGVCLETGSARHLEWEEDDEIEVSATIGEVKFSELTYDDGEPIAQDSDDLDEIVEKKWEIRHGGKTFHYQDDYAAQYMKGSGSKKENVYFYEFETDSGEQLTIEVWIQQSGKETFQVFLSRTVSPDDIEVIATGNHSEA